MDRAAVPTQQSRMEMKGTAMDAEVVVVGVKADPMQIGRCKTLGCVKRPPYILNVRLSRSMTVELPPNPRVFLEIAIGPKIIGKLIIELYTNKVPRTAENFRMLCTGEKGVGRSGANLDYKGCQFHKVVSGFLVQGGDFITNDGTHNESVYGPRFEDENFSVPHDDRGILSMANTGRNTNGGQFFITFGKTPWLDGKNVAFGKVIEGRELLDEIEAVGTKSGTPTKIPKIQSCGEL
jgi:peptidylprolyl isomerase